ncbi:hypothetical protein HN604_03020 [archaeon]|jgi:hypothetical protein|nr:hypothetical protein [archaeon]MBT6183033.1 hypothetical protein [archaeon]MBT6606500.1 hypothetical protein [archaeon]MBT7251335.1 hypothetical protein [archaeon]MBT7661030.1 hypothetical protein [archaeon]
MVKKSVILFFLNLLIILAFGEFGSANNHCTASDVRFNNAQGLYLYSEELIYIADTDNHAIRRYNLTSGSVETIAGGGGNHGNGQGNGITGSSGDIDGPAANARFNKPSGLAMDSNGDLYISEIGNNKIRKLDLGTMQVSTFVGGGNGFGATAVKCGGNDRTECYNGNGADAVFTFYEAGFDSIVGMDFGADDVLYVADTFNNRIRNVTLAGEVGVFAGRGMWVGTSNIKYGLLSEGFLDRRAIPTTSGGTVILPQDVKVIYDVQGDPAGMQLVYTSGGQDGPSSENLTGGGDLSENSYGTFNIQRIYEKNGIEDNWYLGGYAGVALKYGQGDLFNGTGDFGLTRGLRGLDMRDSSNGFGRYLTYVADFGAHRLRVIDDDQNMNYYSGNGAGYDGGTPSLPGSGSQDGTSHICSQEGAGSGEVDDGQLDDCQGAITGPSGVAVNASGNVYFIGKENKLRMVTPHDNYWPSGRNLITLAGPNNGDITSGFEDCVDPVVSQCNDGIDNDGNGHCDFDGGGVGNNGCSGAPDPGCSDEEDNTEGNVVADPREWRNLIGDVITNANFGDTVKLVYVNGAGFTPFEVFEDDIPYWWDFNDDDIIDLLGDNDSLDLDRIAYWEIPLVGVQIGNELETEYELFFEIDSDDSEHLNITGEEDNSEITARITNPACGRNIDVRTTQAIQFKVFDEDDLVNITLTVTNNLSENTLNQTWYDNESGIFVTELHDFNTAGTSEIKLFVENNRGQKFSTISNVMVVDRSQTMKAYAACIDDPVNFENLAPGHIRFNASSSRGIKVFRNGNPDKIYSPNGPDNLILEWTFSDGRTHRGSGNDINWRFHKYISEYGDTWADLSVYF